MIPATYMLMLVLAQAAGQSPAQVTPNTAGAGATSELERRIAELEKKIEALEKAAAQREKDASAPNATAAEQGKTASEQAKTAAEQNKTEQAKIATEQNKTAPELDRPATGEQKTAAELSQSAREQDDAQAAGMSAGQRNSTALDSGRSAAGQLTVATSQGRGADNSSGAVVQPQQGPGIVPVSVTGDYRTSPGTETRLPIAGYMQFDVNKDVGDPFSPDFHRFVLLFGHSFSDRIKFWSEYELEHSILEPSEGRGGELALEQAYLDFLIKPYFNLRAGMVLVPMGIVNERHEPPTFNGVERPFVDTFIIPTTWRELGAGVTGDLGKGFRYRGYITSQLDASQFDAENGIANGRTKGFESSLRNPAKMLRFEYVGVRRLVVGLSGYIGHTGFNTPGVNPRVSIASFDVRYNYKRVDFRGVYANTFVSKAGELNRLLRLQTGVNPNVASQMLGYYLEPAFHLLPRKDRFDLIAFARYETYNTQQKMPAGYLPLEQFNRSSWVTGLTFKPTADIAVKFDYDFNRNQSSVIPAVNTVNFGLGWWF